MKNAQEKESEQEIYIGKKPPEGTG